MKDIWVCGIEWGGGDDPISLQNNMKVDMSHPPSGYDSWEKNISYIFNWQVMKLLSAMSGGKVEDYKSFAEKVQPFVKGRKGYFKMNLYPIGFKDTANDHWSDELSRITGFNSKSEYMRWCKERRFPKIRKWVSNSKPETIICLGKTYRDDFCKAFLDEESDLKTEMVDGHELTWGVNADDSLVIILPFMVNRYGLVKDESIQKVGERIAELRLLTRRHT